MSKKSISFGSPGGDASPTANLPATNPPIAGPSPGEDDWVDRRQVNDPLYPAPRENLSPKLIDLEQLLFLDLTAERSEVFGLAFAIPPSLTWWWYYNWVRRIAA